MVFFFQAEDGIRDWSVTGVQTCALPISSIFERSGADEGAAFCACALHKPNAMTSAIVPTTKEALRKNLGSSKQNMQKCYQAKRLRPPSAGMVHRLPFQPVQNPLPRSVLRSVTRRRRQIALRENDRLAAIRLRKLFEHPPLFLHPAVVGQQTQAVLQRIELKLLVHIVAVPIAEPAHTL